MSTATIQRNQITAYQQPIDEVLAALGTDARRGLSEGEAQARLKRYGKNELTAEKPIPRWRKFLAHFQDVLVILLLIATLISAGLWLHERESALPYEAIAIFAIVLLNAVMGYIQESRAEQAVAALRQMSAAHANVIRDGARQSITATEVAPGDIILIEEGDTVPADARLIQSTALRTAEAALTGESLPVSKDTLPITKEVGLGDRHNMLFSGTAATYGRGKAVVIATGMQTQMGLIAGMLKETPAETTPLQKELARVGKLLGIIVVVIAVVMIATIILVEDVRGFSAIFDVLILGVALAVAAVPEGLPAVVTAGTLLALDASLPGGLIEGSGSMRYGQTIAFTTLVMFQIFNVFNARSDEQSVFYGLFQNHWLWGALGVSLALHVAVIYVPFLQSAFSTVSLTTADWLRCAAVASSVLWLRELSKIVRRLTSRKNA